MLRGLLAIPCFVVLATGHIPASGPPVPTIADAQEVNITKLTSVNYRKGKALPEEIQSLDGKRVSIEGYMALGTLEGVESFEFVPESCECGRSKVQHFIDVTIEEGLTTFRPGRMVLEGVFSVGEVEEDGFVVSLYRLTIRSLDDEE